jgi:hypothetical protein
MKKKNCQTQSIKEIHERSVLRQCKLRRHESEASGDEKRQSDDHFLLKTSTLHTAVLSNNAARLGELLSAPDCDPNARDVEGMTALHHAAAYDEPALVRLLLQHPATDVNARNARLNTPLHSAAAHDSRAAMATLLQHAPIDADAVNVWHESPLMLAAAGNHVACARLLLRHGADRAQRDNWGCDASDVAKSHQAADVAALLQLADGQVPPPEPEAVAVVSSRLRLRTTCLAKLIEAPLDDARFLALLNNSDIDTVTADFFGLTVLHKLVAWNKHALLAPFLTHRRTDATQVFAVRDGKDSPLHVGVQMCAIESVRELLRLAPAAARAALLAARNGEQLTALALAQAMQHDEFVAMLAASGGDV